MGIGQNPIHLLLTSKKQLVVLDVHPLKFVLIGIDDIHIFVCYHYDFLIIIVIIIIIIIYIYLYTSGFQATARSVTNPRWIKDIKVHVATRFDSKLKNYEISGPSYGPHCETCVGST